MVLVNFYFLCFVLTGTAAGLLINTELMDINSNVKSDPTTKSNLIKLLIPFI